MRKTASQIADQVIEKVAARIAPGALKQWSAKSLFKSKKVPDFIPKPYALNIIPGKPGRFSPGEQLPGAEISKVIPPSSMIRKEEFMVPKGESLERLNTFFRKFLKRTEGRPGADRHLLGLHRTNVQEALKKVKNPTKYDLERPFYPPISLNVPSQIRKRTASRAAAKASGKYRGPKERPLPVFSTQPKNPPHSYIVGAMPRHYRGKLKPPARFNIPKKYPWKDIDYMKERLQEGHVPTRKISPQNLIMEKLI